MRKACIALSVTPGVIGRCWVCRPQHHTADCVSKPDHLSADDYCASAAASQPASPFPLSPPFPPDNVVLTNGHLFQQDALCQRGRRGRGSTACWRRHVRGQGRRRRHHTGDSSTTAVCMHVTSASTSSSSSSSSSSSWGCAGIRRTHATYAPCRARSPRDACRHPYPALLPRPSAQQQAAGTGRGKLDEGGVLGKPTPDVKQL
jgi:hypothetical protein